MAVEVLNTAHRHGDSSRCEVYCDRPGLFAPIFQVVGPKVARAADRAVVEMDFPGEAAGKLRFLGVGHLQIIIYTHL